VLGPKEGMGERIKEKPWNRSKRARDPPTLRNIQTEKNRKAGS